MQKIHLFFCLSLVFSSLLLQAQNSDLDFIDVEEGRKSAPENLSTTNNLNNRLVPGQEPMADSNNVLKLGRGDVRLLPNKDGSFELFVQHLPGRESILITDSTAEPDGLADNYTLRAYDWHPTYGDEERVLNGKVLKRDPPLYFLMDSTPGPIQGFEEGSEWFHINLPKAVMFGYPWGREGQFDIGAGTWISIRTFDKPYADYSGPYKDNPFVITTREKPTQPPVVQERQKPFRDLAQDADGKFYEAKNTQDMLDRIDEILAQNTGYDIDIAIVLDTTISMKEDLREIKKQLVPKIAAFRLQPENRDKIQRIGMVFYRDYPPDKYLTKEIDFTSDPQVFQDSLNTETAAGGYDTPEAVYEGIDAGIHKLAWENDKRILIQIGDAIPHLKPRGKVDGKTVTRDAKKKDISLYPILLPNRK